MPRCTWNSLKSMIAAQRERIASFPSTRMVKKSEQRAWREEERAREEWREVCGVARSWRVLERIFDRFLRRLAVPISCGISAPSAPSRLTWPRIQLKRDDVIGAPFDTANRHGYVRNSRQQFLPRLTCLQRCAAWPADGRPLQTPPPASPRPFSDLTATMLLYRCSLCPLPRRRSGPKRLPRA